jgi:hypothetical protein
MVGFVWPNANFQGSYPVHFLIQFNIELHSYFVTLHLNCKGYERRNS